MTIREHVDAYLQEQSTTAGLAYQVAAMEILKGISRGSKWHHRERFSTHITSPGSLQEVSMLLELSPDTKLRVQITPVYPHLCYRLEVEGTRRSYGDWNWRCPESAGTIGSMLRTLGYACHA